MNSVNIILREFDSPLLGKATIGVDYGAWICCEKGISMLQAVGDFDSVTSSQLEIIKKNTEVVVLPQEKDCTDFEAALGYAGAFNKIYVYGAMGGRLDHELLNIELVKRDSRLVLVSAKQIAYTIETGTVTLKNDFKYISFFALEKTRLTLEGFKYPLNNQTVISQDLYLTSNELVEPAGNIIVHEGRILFVGIYYE